MLRNKFRTQGLLLLLLAVVLFVGHQYVRTLPPGVTSLQVTGWSDTPAFQVVGAFWGIAHSPGYPLYTISANLFVRLVELVSPGYEPARAVSLFSSFSALGALTLLYFALRMMNVRTIIAIWDVVVLSFSATFWYYATIAEVYLFNVFLISLSLVIYLLWRQNWDRPRFSKFLGLSLGLLLADHRMSVLWIMAVGIGVILDLRHHKHLIMPTIRNIILFSLPGLLFYLYLPIVPRFVDSAYTRFYTIPTDLTSFLFMVLSREWWGLVQYPENLHDYLTRQVMVFRAQAKELHGIVLELIGMGGIFWGPPAIIFATIFYFIFGAIYQVDDIDSMLIPLTVFLYLGIGIAFERLVRLVEQRTTTKYRPVWSILVGSLLAGILLTSFSTTRATVDHSGDTVGPDMVDSLIIMAEDGFPMIFLGEDNTPLATAQYAKARNHLANIKPIGVTTFRRQLEFSAGQDEGYADQAVQEFFANVWRQGDLVFISNDVLFQEFVPEIEKGVAAGNYFLSDTAFPLIKQLAPIEGMPVLSRIPQFSENISFCGGVVLSGYDIRWVKRRSGIYLRLGLIFTRGDISGNSADYQQLLILPSEKLSEILSSGQFAGTSLSASPLANLDKGNFTRGVYELRLNKAPDGIVLPDEFLQLHFLHSDPSCNRDVIITLPPLE